VIDPEQEYRYLAEAVGGAYLQIAIASDHRINPFDLPELLEDENPESVLRENITRLIGVISLMVDGLSAEEQSIVDSALWETYALKDITRGARWDKPEVPTLQDFYNITREMEGGRNVAVRLQRFVEGTFAGVFNRQTNIDLDQQCIVFNIRDMEEELRPIAMYVVLGFIWNRIRSKLKKRLLVVDEAWIMMRNEESAKFLFSMAKRARKYYLGVTTITQDISDFLGSKYGKPIVTNSSIQLLLRQSPAAIDTLSEVFYLTDHEKFRLLESDVGEGIFFAGLKHVAIKIVASYAEDQIITSDPQQILAIEAAKREMSQGAPE
jgi:type IV secretory pathway VirB4 component